MGQDLAKIRLTPEVIEAINGEFAYQEFVWGGNSCAPDIRASVPNRLVSLSVYLRKAEDAYCLNIGDQETLDALRKVAAIALRALVEHSCPARIMPPHYVAPVLPHQQRVIDEKADLDLKVSKLSTFFDGTVFPRLSHDEQARLTKQCVLMRQYSAVLGERIAAFEPAV